MSSLAVLTDLLTVSYQGILAGGPGSGRHKEDLKKLFNKLPALDKKGFYRQSPLPLSMSQSDKNKYLTQEYRKLGKYNLDKNTYGGKAIPRYTENIRPSKLISSEKLRTNSLHYIVDNPKDENVKENIRVTRTDKGDFIDNGHHRAAVAYLQDDKPLKANVFDIRTKKIQAGGPGSGRHKTFWHGTTSDKLANILKHGLHKEGATRLDESFAEHNTFAVPLALQKKVSLAQYRNTAAWYAKSKAIYARLPHSKTGNVQTAILPLKPDEYGPEGARGRKIFKTKEDGPVIKNAKAVVLKVRAPSDSPVDPDESYAHFTDHVHPKDIRGIYEHNGKKWVDVTSKHIKAMSAGGLGSGRHKGWKSPGEGIWDKTPKGFPAGIELMQRENTTHILQRFPSGSGSSMGRVVKTNEGHIAKVEDVTLGTHANHDEAISAVLQRNGIKAGGPGSGRHKGIHTVYHGGSFKPKVANKGKPLFTSDNKLVAKNWSTAFEGGPKTYVTKMQYIAKNPAGEKEIEKAALKVGISKDTIKDAKYGDGLEDLFDPAAHEKEGHAEALIKQLQKQGHDCAIIPSYHSGGIIGDRDFKGATTHVIFDQSKLKIKAMSAGGPGSGRHPSGLTKEEQLAKNREILNQKRAVAREAKKPFLSDKAKLAMKFMNVAHKDMQDKAEHAEHQINKFLKGSIKSKDNAPFDIVHEVNGKRHGIEVKAILYQKNDKITQKGEAIHRKMKYAKANKIKGIHTVAVDYRDKTPVVYHRAGVGSFRLGSMTKVKGGFNGLSNHIR